MPSFRRGRPRDPARGFLSYRTLFRALFPIRLKIIRRSRILRLWRADSGSFFSSGAVPSLRRGRPRDPPGGFLSYRTLFRTLFPIRLKSIRQSRMPGALRTLRFPPQGFILQVPHGCILSVSYTLPKKPGHRIPAGISGKHFSNTLRGV